MSSSLFNQVTRRSVSDEDAAFLLDLYADSRAEEMAFFPWTPAQKEAFLRQQFAAQQMHYRTQFPDASSELLLLDGLPIGKLLVLRRPDEIRLVDIALLPEHQGQGLGTELLGELIRESNATKIPLRLHVETHNPAFRLYTRSGFRSVSSTEIYTLMEYVPSLLA